MAETRKKILIADDSNVVRILLARTLRSEFKVSEAVTRAEAIAGLQQGDIDLILTDREFPMAQDGEAVLRAARAAGVPAIMLTDNPPLPEDRPEDLQDVEIWAKPISVLRLVARVRELLGTPTPAE